MLLADCRSPLPLGDIPDLPTLPAAASLALAISEDPDATASDLLRVIMSDPPLAAKLLRVANSVYYQRGVDVKDLQTAIVRLGFANIRTLLVGLSVIRSFDDFFRGAAYSREDFWAHSIATGLMAAHLTRSTANLSSSTAFIAGLLHDIGKLLLDRHHRKGWTEALWLSRLSSIPLDEAERRTMGGDHAAVGGDVLSAWRLPAEVAEPVRWHHQPSGAAERHRPHAAAIQVADFLCIRAGIGYSGNEHPAEPPPELLVALRATDERVRAGLELIERSPLMTVLIPR